MSEAHANYLRDLGYLVREAGEKAKREAGDSAFEQGRVMAYYEVLSLMQQQAVAFPTSARRPLDEGLDPDRDLT